MMNLIEGESGFTLIELLVVVVILGLVITSVLNINLGGFEFLLLNRDRIKLQDEARLISTNLERQIRKSSGIDNDKSDRYNLYLENGDRFFVENQIFKFTDSVSGSTRNITSNVITTYSFIYPDDSVVFEFNLNLDNSSYQINNRFYPRAIN